MEKQPNYLLRYIFFILIVLNIFLIINFLYKPSQLKFEPNAQPEKNTFSISSTCKKIDITTWNVDKEINGEVYKIYLFYNTAPSLCENFCRFNLPFNDREELIERASNLARGRCETAVENLYNQCKDMPCENNQIPECSISNCFTMFWEFTGELFNCNPDTGNCLCKCIPKVFSTGEVKKECRTPLCAQPIADSNKLK